MRWELIVNPLLVLLLVEAIIECKGLLKFLIDEIIQEIIRYNEIWHARFQIFSINVNELNKQLIPCKFGNIMLELLMK
jgi:hypothetical protein